MNCCSGDQQWQSVKVGALGEPIVDGCIVKPRLGPTPVSGESGGDCTEKNLGRRRIERFDTELVRVAKVRSVALQDILAPLIYCASTQQKYPNRRRRILHPHGLAQQASNLLPPRFWIVEQQENALF